jgi:hypothetical protein
MNANEHDGVLPTKSSGVVVDWKTLPKGSPERKAAIAAERRALAAAAREKKAVMHAYLPSAEAVSAGESERRRLLAEAAWWVALHPVSVTPPDELRRMLQKVKRANESLFVKQFVLAVLPAPPKEAPLPPPAPERTEARVLGPVREKLRRLLEEMGSGSPSVEQPESPE